MSSVHHKLERVRPPRVHITYPVTSAGAVETRELPLVIGVLADFTGSNEDRLQWRDRRFVTVDFDNLDAVIASMQPRICCSVGPSTAAELEIDLTFERLEDFEPERIVERVEPLRELQQSADENDRAMVQQYLDLVLHAPEFQALEATWRGLWYLVSRVESGSLLKVMIIDVTKQELLRDLQRAPEFDQTHLFRKVYEEPFGASGGEPFALFIGDFALGSSRPDMELLEKLAQIASACLAPFISAAAPDMFGLDEFAQLSEPRDLGRVFDNGDTYAKWRAFRESEDARYVGLVLPRMLGRVAYGVRPGEPAGLLYDEDTHGRRYLLWSNPAYALGACIANAFSRYGWCGAIRGFESGGLVEGLPTWEQHIEGEGRMRSSTEVLISDRREKEVSDLGFIPLLQGKGTDHAVFYSTPSCARGLSYDNDAATITSRVACQLQYVLATSRFGHYLKSLALEHRDSCETRGELERLLNSWISQYVLTDDQASHTIRARFPLRQARIDLVDTPGRPGAYRIVAFLNPHFQLDELPVSMRLVTDLV
jgi:type VI secretion system protein ImpC